MMTFQYEDMGWRDIYFNHLVRPAWAHLTFSSILTKPLCNHLITTLTHIGYFVLPHLNTMPWPPQATDHLCLLVAAYLLCLQILVCKCSKVNKILMFWAKTYIANKVIFPQYMTFLFKQNSQNRANWGILPCMKVKQSTDNTQTHTNLGLFHHTGCLYLYVYKLYLS